LSFLRDVWLQKKKFVLPDERGGERETTRYFFSIARRAGKGKQLFFSVFA